MSHENLGTHDNSLTLSPRSAINTSQGICAICLGVPENKSFASNCLHEFCFICLLEWSKVKAECPLCKQSFCSIIHNVKSDHQYDNLEIKKLEKRSSGALPSSGPLLQQQMQHNSVQLSASNVHDTVRNRLHAPATSARRQSIRTSTRLSAVPQQSEEQTVAQNHLTDIQQSRQRITSTVRYSLRSRTIIQEDLDSASNVELVSEFCPVNSSAPSRFDMLLVCNVTAAPVGKSQWWHSFVSTDIRNRMVQKLVQAIISDPRFANQNQMEMVEAYTRQIEKDIYTTANSKHLYNTLCLEKITELKDMDRPGKTLLLQLIQSYDPSSSFPQTRSNATQQVPVPLDETHFTAGNFRNTTTALSENIEDDDLAILEIPPKPAPEVITLSDSDED